MPAATQTPYTATIGEYATKHAWNSVVRTSRVLVANSDNKPYTMFVTVAQKTFKFEANNKFIFTVTSPLNYTYENGSWTINNSVLNIGTRIPIGPLEMKNCVLLRLRDSEPFALSRDIRWLVLNKFRRHKNNR